MTLTIGSVFSGIGGFELGFLGACEAAGIPARVAWVCEIEPSAQKVLRERFPEATLYDDIETLDPAEVEPVDIYVGGSPCQGFSMAGARTGLEHIESRLFTDYVRVMDGLAQRGLSYALWENVPGALSQRNEDGTPVFPQLIAALTLGLDAPLGDADVVAGRFRADARWNAGLAGDGRRAVSWRVLDSRHFGVPQRRRRVFACVAFGHAADRRAFEVLLEREGVSGDLAACQQEGSEPASALTASLGDGGADDNRAQGRHLVPDTAKCLTTDQRYDLDTEDMIVSPTGRVAHTLTGEGFDASEDGTGRGTPIVPAAFNWQQGDAEYRLSDDGSTPTLGTTSAPAVLLTMREGKPGGGKGPLLSEEQSLTLATGNGQVLFAPEGVSIKAFQSEAGGGPAILQDGSAHTLTSAGHGAALTQYGVRRLTPVECERLQGFPDGWTEPCGSDSARYRALGNAVTVNTVSWIFSRIATQQVA